MRKKSEMARGVQGGHALAAYPAVLVALVVSFALALTPFGPSKVMALTPSPSTTTPAAATTTPAAPTATPTPIAIPDLPTPTAASPTPTTDVSIVVPTETLAPTGRTTTLYPLSATPVVGTLTGPSLSAPIIGSPNIHGPYTTSSGECATCHRTHTAKGANLLTKSTPQSTLCFTCHDGTGANTNVSATYTDAAVPQNDVADRLIYRHDTLAPTSHTSSSVNEFGGVSNRHSECSDCHNPHQAKGTDSTTLPDGVTASSRLAGVSGVSVSNGAAGTTPPSTAYTFLDGKTPATVITREYQLCFKCHSGFTKLPLPLTPLTPGEPRSSTDLLDKAAEFNPNNPSFHPIEAKGTNATAKMQLSLDGGSVWNFNVNDTIRCVNCHASPAKLTTLAGGDLPPHTSQNPGMLLRKYRDRALRTASEKYDGADFALCYMCHAEAPFSNETGTDTNFGFHGYHLTNMGSESNQGSTDIDTPGAGAGYAICAECHFRLHSTTFKVGAQKLTGDRATGASRLVNFAPNVLPYQGKLDWTSTGVGSGSCTLTCHGITHSSDPTSGAQKLAIYPGSP